MTYITKDCQSCNMEVEVEKDTLGVIKTYICPRCGNEI